MTLGTLPERPRPARHEVGVPRVAPEACAFASEGAATAAVEAPGLTSLATLLTRHILRDGELVVLILRPSVWFVPLSCLKFIAAVLIFMIAAKVFDEHLPYTSFAYMETGI